MKNLTCEYCEYRGNSFGNYKNEEEKKSSQPRVFILHGGTGNRNKDLPTVHGADEERNEQDVVKILQIKESPKCYFGLHSTVGEIYVDKKVYN